MDQKASTRLTRREFAATAIATASLASCRQTVSAAPPKDAGRSASNAAVFEPVRIPDWVYGITRMSYLGPDSVADAAKIGVQVVHGNAVWPYFPLRRDGGGLARKEAQILRKFVDDCHRHGMRLVLGLPPFPPVNLMQAHPEWRIAPADSGAQLKIVPLENNLGTRLACNVGPWGDYLIDVCAELVEDFGVDGFSFDGNYHPPICICAACKQAYQRDAKRPLPPKADLDDVPYRQYLVWRGEQLERHYQKMQQRLKGIRADVVIMSWTVNAGRYGHFLHSPRAMPTRLNLLFDLPMQEWWLDETNVGASVAPSFGAAYLSAVTGGRPCGCEPYLMSRGNPYRGDSFPAHERMARSMLTLAHGSVTAHSMGWTGGAAGAAPVFAETKRREPWLTRRRRIPWAAILVSEQTRQFYAYRDIADRFLPHVFGAFRMFLEEHLPITLVNDWDITAEGLADYRVLVLPNAAALSDAQVAAIRQYVRRGGGLMATTETSLCDELGRPRADFALADVFGVSFRGRPQSPQKRTDLDPNFAIAIDDKYWRERVGAAAMSWADQSLWHDATLRALVPSRAAQFKGPQVLVTPRDAAEVVAHLRPEGGEHAIPAIIARKFGAGRVVYMAAALDAALWSYAYPYQRRMLARAVGWAAGGEPPIRVTAPMCVQTTFFQRDVGGKRQIVIHLFNNVNTTAHHGAPAADVPLREETVPIGGIRITFVGDAPKRFHVEPGAIEPKVTRNGDQTLVELPPLELHAMLVADAE